MSHIKAGSWTGSAVPASTVIQKEFGKAEGSSRVLDPRESGKHWVVTGITCPSEEGQALSFDFGLEALVQVSEETDSSLLLEQTQASLLLPWEILGQFGPSHRWTTTALICKVNYLGAENGSVCMCSGCLSDINAQAEWSRPSSIPLLPMVHIVSELVVPS